MRILLGIAAAALALPVAAGAQPMDPSQGATPQQSWPQQQSPSDIPMTRADPGAPSGDVQTAPSSPDSSAATAPSSASDSSAATPDDRRAKHKKKKDRETPPQ